VLTNRIPLLLIWNLSVPLVTNPIVSEVGEYIPVFKSPINVKSGIAGFAVLLIDT
jgi:hypothetical protein